MWEHITRDTPAAYRIVIEGLLDERFRSWFEDARLHTDGDRTLLDVTVTDQSALHGILRRVHDLHLRLVSVERLDPQSNPTF